MVPGKGENVKEWGIERERKEKEDEIHTEPGKVVELGKRALYPFH